MARNLRIAIAAYGRSKMPGNGAESFDLERNVREAGMMVAVAAQEGADLVVLPETFAVQGSDDWTTQAEPVDGYTVTQLAQVARQHKVGIAAGHVLSIDGKAYNSIVLLDRQGEVAAIYHKAFPTIWEMERGITPGPGALVADTPFGRLGFALCYDLNFAELRLAYRDQKPEAILFCSAFRGGLQTRWWAYETRSYVVSSVIDPQSLIVNPLGRAIGETDVWTRELIRTINLDYAVLHYDYTNQTIGEARLKYGSEIEIEGAEAEGVMLVSASGPYNLPDLMREFGWQDVETYFDRARLARARVMQGKELSRGLAPW